MKLYFVAVTAALACTAAYAADTGAIDDTTTAAVTKPASTPNPVIYNYHSSRTDDGKLLVTLDEASKSQVPNETNVMTIFAPNVRTTEKLLHSQDWYMTVDPNGNMRGIYTMPRNTALPSTTLRSLGEGFGIMKVNPRSSFFKVFPSAHQIASQLTSFTRAAQHSVCDQDNKPETLSAAVDVQPGWSGAGRIKFNATWNVDDLCNQPKG